MVTNVINILFRINSLPVNPRFIVDINGEYPTLKQTFYHGGGTVEVFNPPFLISWLYVKSTVLANIIVVVYIVNCYTNTMNLGVFYGNKRKMYS